MPNLFLGFPVSRAKFAELAANAITDLYETPNLFLHTRFESLDGLSPFTSGSGTNTMYADELGIASGATAGSVASISEILGRAEIPMTWDKRRRFKIKVRAIIGNDASSAVYISTGQTPPNTRGFGFQYQNTKLIGYAQNGATPATVDLITGLTAPYDRSELLEAELTPGISVKFYVDGVFKGQVTTNLPTGTTDATYVIRIRVANSGAVNHDIRTSTVKFQQQA